MKLNQVIAITDGRKQEYATLLSELYRVLQQPKVFSGLSKIYKPDNEGSEVYPPEGNRVQYNVSGLTEQLSVALVNLFDCVFIQDSTNCQASADVVVDGKTIIKSVPVTHLLFLEKKIKELLTFAETLPTLPLDQEWEKRDVLSATRPSVTIRRKRETDFRVVVQATDRHPADVREIQSDVREGIYETTYMHGGIAVKEKQALVRRIKNLQEAIIKAREEANDTVCEEKGYAKDLVSYIFHDVTV